MTKLPPIESEFATTEEAEAYEYLSKTSGLSHEAIALGSQRAIALGSLSVALGSRKAIARARLRPLAWKEEGALARVFLAA